MASTNPRPDPVARDIQNVVTEAQDLLQTVQSEGSQRMNDKMGELRSKVQAQVDTAKQSLAELQQKVQENSKVAIDTTDQYVRANPWRAVGIGAAVGALLGVLIARR